MRKPLLNHHQHYNGSNAIAGATVPLFSSKNIRSCIIYALVIFLIPTLLWFVLLADVRGGVGGGKGRSSSSSHSFLNLFRQYSPSYLVGQIGPRMDPNQSVNSIGNEWASEVFEEDEEMDMENQLKIEAHERDFPHFLPSHGQLQNPRHQERLAAMKRGKPYWPHMMNTYRACPAHPDNSTELAAGSYWITNPQTQAEKYIRFTFIDSKNISHISRGQAAQAYYRADWKIDWETGNWWEQDLGGEGTDYRLLLWEMEFLKMGEADPDPGADESLSVLFAIPPTRSYAESHHTFLTNMETNEKLAKALAADMTCLVHFTRHPVHSDSPKKWKEDDYTDVTHELAKLQKVILHWPAINHGSFLRCPLPYMTIDMMRTASFNPILTIEAVTFFAPSFDVVMTLPICRIHVRQHGVGLCTSNLFGPPSAIQPWMVEEWLNYLLYIGFDHIYLWDKFGSLRDAAEPYRQRGLLEYSLGPRVEMCTGVYHDQIHLENMCLMRARHAASYLHYADNDEYMVFTHPAMIEPDSEFLSPPHPACHDHSIAWNERPGDPGEVCPSVLKRWLSIDGQDSIRSWWIPSMPYFDSPGEWNVDPTYLQTKTGRFPSPPDHVLSRYKKRIRGMDPRDKIFYRPIGIWRTWIHGVEHQSGIRLKVYQVMGYDGGLELLQNIHKEFSGNYSLAQPKIGGFVPSDRFDTKVLVEAHDTDRLLPNLPVSIACVTLHHMFNLYGNPSPDIIKRVRDQSPEKANPKQTDPGEYIESDDPAVDAVMTRFISWLDRPENEWMRRQRKKMGWTKEYWGAPKKEGVKYPDGVWQVNPSPFYTDEIDSEAENWAYVPPTTGPQYC